MKAQVLTVICPDCNLALPVVGGIAAHPGEGCEDFRVEAEVLPIRKQSVEQRVMDLALQNYLIDVALKYRYHTDVPPPAD